MSEKERLQLEQECLLKYSKAQMINKYIDEFEENSKLSELWCKSQQENKQLKEDFAILKKLQMISNNILNELEEWLKTIVKYETLHKSGYMTVRGEWGEEILDKIQELKEKYK